MSPDNNILLDYYYTCVQSIAEKALIHDFIYK